MYHVKISRYRYDTDMKLPICDRLVVKAIQDFFFLRIAIYNLRIF